VINQVDEPNAQTACQQDIGAQETEISPGGEESKGWVPLRWSKTWLRTKDLFITYNNGRLQ